MVGRSRDLDLSIIVATLSIIGVRNSVEFDLSLAGAHVSHVHKEDVEVKMDFYISNLDSGLKFPHSEFSIGVFIDYGIAPSQLVPNS